MFAKEPNTFSKEPCTFSQDVCTYNIHTRRVGGRHIVLRCSVLQCDAMCCNMLHCTHMRGVGGLHIHIEIFSNEPLLFSSFPFCVDTVPGADSRGFCRDLRNPSSSNLLIFFVTIFFFFRHRRRSRWQGIRL